MKPFLFALMALLPAQGALAHDDRWDSDWPWGDPPARIAARQDVRDARLAITTEGGEASLVLTDRVVAVQLSEAKMDKLRHKLRDKRESRDYEGDNVLAQTIRTAVLTAVNEVFDHSIQYPIRDLQDAEYRNGRLILTNYDGRRVFARVSMNGENVLENFSDADARAFVREFYRVKARR